MRSLSVLDAVAMVVGIVIGAGIFRMPQWVAANTGDTLALIGVWVAGGLISLIGTLCYAELAAAYPNTGGDYYFLMRALGAPPAFLFAWARMTVIQTGSIALLAFVIGDYVVNSFLEPNSPPTVVRLVSSLSAATVVVALTLVNLAGVRQGKGMQKLLTALVVLGLLLVTVAGVSVALRGAATTATTSHAPSGSLGLAMIFVLFTYSGWNEAAYLSAEMKGGPRSIVAALVLGIAAVTSMYLLVNLAYLAALGFDGMRSSEAIAAETLRAAWGTGGALLITVIVIVAALSTANATIFTGARSNYALGRDFPLFRFLGQWSDGANTPRTALLVQGVIALALVGLGGSQNGVETMVAYTSWVFWTFFLLVGVSLMVLRYKEPQADRPFRVPFYPWLPLVFCGFCAFMLYSSLNYAKSGALLGVWVLLAGVPFMVFACVRRTPVVANPPVTPLANAPENVDD
jgi:amino acid transporter